MPLSLLVVCLLATGASAATYGGGSGTAGDPYRISTAEHLNAIGNNSADWDKQFKLMEDIDLSAYDETNFNLIGYWATLGATNNEPFKGIFDGNGKTISNFHYRSLDSGYIGLFRYASGTIKNLRLVNATVSGNGSGTGALVGYLDRGAIKYCEATGLNVSGDLRVGGLVGESDGGIADCSTKGRISGGRYVGGMVGMLGGAGSVTTSFSRAAVSGNESVGGLVGVVGGDAATVESCYASGSVDGGSYVGGLVGLVSRGRVYKCYSNGSVSGDETSGGLAGGVMIFGDASRSFWDMETSGRTTSAGGTGKTTAEMQSESTFSAVGWGFGIDWLICEGINYPVLIWQISVADLQCPDGVEMIDFAVFARMWRQRNCGGANWYCEGADFTQSGDVGFDDLAVLADNWLAGVE